MQPLGQRVVWPTPRAALIEEFEPRAPGPGEVQVQTEMTLISPGSERGWLSGQYAFPFPGAGFPFHPGYSLVGRVTEVGAHVSTVNEGDVVFTGGPGYGCHASVVTFDVRLVHAVPDEIDPEAAVFFTLADTALSAVRRARPELGESGAVVGLGPLGLLAIQAAASAGLTPLIGADTNPTRRKLALRCGAEIVFDPTDAEAAGAARRAVEGGFAVSVDFSGGSDTGLELAMSLVGSQGRVIAGSRTVGKSSLDLVEGLFIKSASLTHMHVMQRPNHDSRPGSWTVADQWRAFCALVRTGRMTPTRLVTEHVGVLDLPVVYQRILAGDPDIVGVVVDWAHE